LNGCSKRLVKHLNVWQMRKNHNISPLNLTFHLLSLSTMHWTKCNFLFEQTRKVIVIFHIQIVDCLIRKELGGVGVSIWSACFCEPPIFAAGQINSTNLLKRTLSNPLRKIQGSHCRKPFLNINKAFCNISFYHT